MTGEKDAPAEMPGDAVRRLICDSALASPERLERLATAVNANFAPILAEKEREKAAALGLVQGHAAVIATLEARALAAEAALAAVKEAVTHWRHFAETTMLPGEEKHLVEGLAQIAAAIRAEGE